MLDPDSMESVSTTQVPSHILEMLQPWIVPSNSAYATMSTLLASLFVVLT
jgi:hypothetical protein